jgi:hypothetical protein
MTRKDYRLIAEAISKASYFNYVDDGFDDKPSKEREIDWLDLVVHLQIAFKKDNPNFNERKFVDACEPK